MLYSRAVSLQCSTATGGCIYLSQLRRRYACSANFMKQPKSFSLSSGCQANGFNLSLYKKQLGRSQNMGTFANIVIRQLCMGLSIRRYSVGSHFTRLPLEKCSVVSRRNSLTILGGVAIAIFSGLLVSQTVNAKASIDKSNGDTERRIQTDTSTHGKKVHRDYYVIGIPGDGRCLFRSVVHGACIRVGKPAPGEELQRQLADELREMVADEFIKRRAETEWFVEGDFDSYVARIRKPHVWGGEPELFMASHVLQVPITVYMHDEDAGGLIVIAEYGKEYGKDKEDPVQVLYHGFGHYDALHIPRKLETKSRL